MISREMVREVLTVRNRLGLHARAAAKLVQTASRFKSAVRVARPGDGMQMDGKSVLELLMLAASAGTELEFIIEGEDEEEARRAIAELLASDFGE